jgi:hypothetical protein
MKDKSFIYGHGKWTRIGITNKWTKNIHFKKAVEVSEGPPTNCKNGCDVMRNERYRGRDQFGQIQNILPFLHKLYNACRKHRRPREHSLGDALVRSQNNAARVSARGKTATAEGGLILI